MASWSRGWRVVVLLTLGGCLTGLGLGQVMLTTDPNSVRQEVGMIGSAGVASTADVMTSDANKVKASFLHKVPRYVTSPEWGAVGSFWPVWRAWLRLPTWEIRVLARIVHTPGVERERP